MAQRVTLIIDKEEVISLFIPVSASLCHDKELSYFGQEKARAVAGLEIWRDGHKNITCKLTFI